MPKTLLLADDSVTIRKVVGISFASQDVTLVTVDNGDDAIVRAREIRPDAILADVVMPGKNGYEVCEAIKADPALQHIPVLLLTGTFEAFDEERARRAGAAGHVAKPFEAQSLVEEVRRLFTGAKAPAAAPPAPPAPSSPAPSSAEAFDFPDEGEAPGGGGAATETVLLSSSEAGDGAADGALDLEETELFDEAPPSGGGAQAEGTVILNDALETGDDLAFGELGPEIADLGSGTLPSDLGEAAADFLAPDLSSATEDLMGTTADEIRPPGGRPPSDSISGAPMPDGLDFDFEDTDRGEGEFPRGGGLAEATVLDPAGASGFDVSSSDLGDPLGSSDASGLELDDDAPALDRMAGLGATALDSRTGGSDLDDAFDDEEPLGISRGSDAEATVVAPDLGITGLEAAESPPAASSGLEPRAQRQLHDTLEKIAWEAFSEVTEKIVRQALERIETIAWEVIPQLTEALVREEIRRMKGEGGDSD